MTPLLLIALFSVLLGLVFQEVEVRRARAYIDEHHGDLPSPEELRDEGHSGFFLAEVFRFRVQRGDFINRHRAPHIIRCIDPHCEKDPHCPECCNGQPHEACRDIHWEACACGIPDSKTCCTCCECRSTGDAS